ncbi:MAG: DUF4440 domain-containing protein, partial [Gemmatimonadaceae bacterium]
MIAQPVRFLGLILALVCACATPSKKSDSLTEDDRAALADSVRLLLVNTYDLSQPQLVERMMRLYPDSGRVVSAASGSFTTTRDALERQVKAFWSGTGRFMQRPQWKWDAWAVDVLTRDAIVVTAAYTVPHMTPQGTPHVIGGAWTSVWLRRDGRWQIVQEHLSDLPVATTDRL